MDREKVKMFHVEHFNKIEDAGTPPINVKTQGTNRYDTS